MRLYQQLAGAGMGDARAGGMADAAAAGNPRGMAGSRGPALGGPASFEDTDLDLVCGARVEYSPFYAVRIHANSFFTHDSGI
jgi:hypothetical protein